MAESQRSIWELLGQTWPAKLGKSVLGGMALPGDVYAGRVDPLSEEAIGRATDLAGVAMTGSMPFAAKAATEIPGMTLTSGLRSPPKLVSGYHGTTAAENFSKFKTSDKDLGVHFSVDPNVALYYTKGGDFYGPPTVVGGRTYPVVADIKKPYNFPVDIGGTGTPWSDREGAMGVLNSIYKFRDQYIDGPWERKFLPTFKKIEKAAAAPGKWEDNFSAIFQNKGYDALRYSHGGGDSVYPFHDSYMVFDPNKVMPKYSPEAQSLIKERGVVRPRRKLYADDDEFVWPEGMLK